MTEQPKSVYDDQPDLQTLNRLQEAHNRREREDATRMANEAAKVIALAALAAVNNTSVVTDDMVKDAVEKVTQPAAIEPDKTTTDEQTAEVAVTVIDALEEVADVAEDRAVKEATEAAEAANEAEVAKAAVAAAKKKAKK